MTLREDSELERVGENRWRGEVSERWWIQRGPFGGYVSTFLVRALIAAVDDPARPPRSFTVHFVDAPRAGPIDVVAATERVGRSSSSLSLRMEQEGRPMAVSYTHLTLPTTPYV